MKLTASEIKFFHREGFLAIPRPLTGAEELATIRKIYDRLFAERRGWEEGRCFDLAGNEANGKELHLPQILGPSNYAPELKETRLWAVAGALGKQLLGGETVNRMGDHAILKPGPAETPTPWHQDEAYWDPDLEYRALSIWIPLQDVDTRNGCMHFIPGSHRREVLPHHCIGGDVRVHGLEVDLEYIDPSNAVPCPLPMGGATFHLSKTLHYTSPNRTPEPRRAWILGVRKENRPSKVKRVFSWNVAKKTPRMERAAGAAKGSGSG